MSDFFRTAIGQDSHRLIDCSTDAEVKQSGKPLMLGGILIPDEPGLEGNSDADVILHALTNAVSGITGINILGEKADELCESGATNSLVYLKEALSYLPSSMQIIHLSVSVEAARPKLAPHIEAIRRNLARILRLPVHSIGLTATSGEGLTACGRGEGIMATCILTVRELV